MAALTIAVVEDNAITRTAFRVTLETGGFTVLEAEDGAGALARMADRPDLMLVDIGLPDVDGFTLVRRLRELPGGSDIPILALSGFFSPEEEASLPSIGFNDYLTKPVRPDQLLQTVRAYLPPPEELAALPGAGRRVLLVEDDPAQSKLMSIHLGLAGFRVTTCQDGREAFDAARRDPPDVVISDVLLPRLNGFELCRALRRDPGLVAVPVVLISAAFTEQADVMLATMAGASSLVLKTTDPADLVRAALAALDTPPPEPSDAPSIVDSEAYARRSVRQLERQVGVNQRLQARVGWLEDKLDVITGLAESLAGGMTIEATVDELLHRCLDASGASRGLAYLRDETGRLIPRTILGFPAGAGECVTAVAAALLHRVVQHSVPQAIPSADISSQQAAPILEQAGARSLMIIPLTAGGERLGALLLASPRDDLGEAWLDVAQAVGRQIGQAMALARALSQLQRNEERLGRTAEALAETNARLEETIESLRAAQQQNVQQERLRAVGEMSSGIAHDFNNALAMIIGYSDLLLSSPEHLQNAGQVTATVQLIQRAATDAASVVARLREFYRQREPAEQVQAVDLDAIVDQVIALTRPKWSALALARGATIRVAADLGNVPPIVGSEAELREALTNLIMNAADAIPEEGTIAVRTRADDERVIVEVADTGVGMTDDVRLRCLEPFFTTKGEQGTGMGLPMVYGVIRRHGGTIDVESAPGAGTTIRVGLPLAPPASEVATGPRPDEPASRPLRVLLVEDHPQIRSLLAQYLELDGHQVQTAENGRDGLSQFQAGTFDLVITDRAMPELSGDQLAEAIEQASAVPVVMLTGFGPMMQDANELPRGVDLVVAKPVKRDALRRAVAEVTGAETADR